MFGHLLLANGSVTSPILDWTAIIIAFITVVVGGSIGTRVINWCLDRFFSKKITAAEAVRINLEIESIINGLREDLNAHSVVVIETENGEKLCRPGQLMFVTMIAESVADPKHSTQARWIEVPVDLSYNQALRSLIESPDGMVSYRVDEFPSRIIRDMYAELGVKRATLVKIPSKPNYIRYIIMRSSEDHGSPHAVARSILASAAQQLASIYNAH